MMSTMRGHGLLFDLMLAMMQPQATAPYLAATSLMWVVMMLAMMTPAVLPVVLTFWRLTRGAAEHRSRDGVLFGVSYLVVWCGFGVLASLLQWALHRGALLDTQLLAATAPVLGAGLAITAGLYQLTPFKAACLTHCQTPIGYLMGHWREGALGAVRMGLGHGSYCLGCCWALMLLMFVGGVMSVGTMVLISAFILLERVLPPGRWVTAAPGALLIAWGAWELVTR